MQLLRMLRIIVDRLARWTNIPCPKAGIIPTRPVVRSIEHQCEDPGTNALLFLEERHAPSLAGYEVDYTISSSLRATLRFPEVFPNYLERYGDLERTGGLRSVLKSDVTGSSDEGEAADSSEPLRTSIQSDDLEAPGDEMGSHHDICPGLLTVSDDLLLEASKKSSNTPAATDASLTEAELSSDSEKSIRLPSTRLPTIAEEPDESEEGDEKEDQLSLEQPSAVLQDQAG